MADFLSIEDVKTQQMQRVNNLLNNVNHSIFDDKMSESLNKKKEND